MRPLLFFIFPICLLSCSTNRNVYRSNDLTERTTRHQTIAILPFYVVQTGYVGKKESQKEIAANNEKWGYTFQESLLSYALKYTSRNKKGKVVSFQAIQKTNGLLKESGLSLEEIYKKQPEELARLLKVDAVLMTTLGKNKNFSDGVAYGLAASKAIVTIVSARRTVDPLPINASDINMNSYLYDGADSKLLWKTDRQGGVRLPDNVEGLVEYYSNWIAKKLPYKS